MKAKVYEFSLNLSWEILSVISRIDRFDASWASIERLEGKILRQLRHIATIQSVGASTRIEGSKMSDEDVAKLLNNIGISKIDNNHFPKMLPKCHKFVKPNRSPQPRPSQAAVLKYSIPLLKKERKCFSG